MALVPESDDDQKSNRTIQLVTGSGDEDVKVRLIPYVTSFEA